MTIVFFFFHDVAEILLINSVFIVHHVIFPTKIAETTFFCQPTCKPYCKSSVSPPFTAETSAKHFFKRQLHIVNVVAVAATVLAMRMELLISLRWPIYIINAVDKSKFCVSGPHRRSTTVSLEKITPLLVC